MRPKRKEPTELDLLEIFTIEMNSQGRNRRLVRKNIDAALAALIGTSLEKLQGLARKCLAKEWLECTAIGCGQFDQLCLSELGFNEVRTWQRKQESLAKRSALKRAADYIEDHSGLFVLLSFLMSLSSLLISLAALLRTNYVPLHKG